MNIKLEVHMQGYPHSGYVAWIDNSRNFNMVVQGESPEAVTKKLIKSLKVTISYVFGVDITSIQDKQVDETEYESLMTALKDNGKKELNFKLATANKKMDLDIISDILELKFDGNEISPSKVKPSEIAQLISDFEKALVACIKEDNVELDVSEVLFTFESIGHKSLGLNFKPKLFQTLKVEDAIKKSFRKLSERVKTNDFVGFNNDGINGLKGIAKFTKKYGCIGSFILNNETLSIITPETEIKQKPVPYLKGDTNVYGKLINIGGEKPNIHLKVNEDYVIIFDATEKEAKDLAARLYDFIGVRGSAKWEIETSKIVEFKLLNILEYNPTSIKGAFNSLKNITSGVWDNYNTNQEINNLLKQD